jgi:eukaryotic-like serine/threonine-protein kinase
MELKPGAKLGPYEIVSAIGKGGMGEVWKARDPRLGRDVAIKVSAQQFTDRFEREARAIAALNHPNICTLYDVGPNYLVMEFVAGPTLAERIAQGPIPLEETLVIARQIADALEAAHEKAIVHRDLKPANVKIKPDGSVKVLDFGLAKSGEAAELTADSPTMMSIPGMILGTAGYMAPEQARAKEVDKRADIWAFGVVLYEMLTGRRLFEGETISDTLASIIKEQPGLSLVPAKVRPLIESCLEKDPKKRLRDIGDAWKLLSSDDRGEPAAPPVPTRSPYSRMAWGTAALLLLAVLALGFVHFREKPPVEQRLRYQIPTPGIADAKFPVLSPDGRHLAFVTNNGGKDQVWVHAMDTLETKPLAGTDGAGYPFWSPDGAYLGFFAEGKLRKIAIAGGPPQTLCDATTGRGGTWNRHDVILFSPGPASAIFRVPAAGGTPAPVTKLAGNGSGEGNRFPVFLPDGVHFLYSVGSNKPNASGVFVGTLDGSAPSRILPDASNALYAGAAAPGGAGYILFRREDTLMAQPFDAKSLKTADAFPIAEQVPNSVNSGFGAFSVSQNGLLVFLSGAKDSDRELVWMDRGGKRLGALGKPGAFVEFAISPDEKTLAARIGNTSQSDIWLEDMGRGVLSRFTFRSGSARNPVWSPDGANVAFSSLAPGSYAFDIFRKPAGGNGQEELLLHAGINGWPEDWSPDGKWIAYQQEGQKTGIDISLLPLTGDRKPVSYLETSFDEREARFSPDGKWMAYQSSESGQFQVYVQTVPPSGAKYQISSSGGTQPQWRRDGKELFYISADQKLMAVAVRLGATVEAGVPEPLFPVVLTQFAGVAYRPSHNGQRFLVNVPAGGAAAAAAQPLTVVTNWQAAPKK